MAHITLSDVCVDFPVFSSQSRGLINTVLKYGKSNQARIEASGLSGVRVHALRDINLELKSGDRVGLVGRNGAGKTTLLRVLSGIYEPITGVMDCQGKTSALTDLLLGMDQDASGYHFIVTRGIVMGLSKKQARALIPDVEDFTEMGDYLHLPVRAYSSGMLLRLAFAVSTAITPDILLLDEMIGVGDAQFLKRAKQRLHTLMSKVDILVLASHNPQILRSFCTKGLLMDGGRIAFAGPIDECLKRHLAPDLVTQKKHPLTEKRNQTGRSSAK